METIAEEIFAVDDADPVVQTSANHLSEPVFREFARQNIS
jgi:hypothetical protein